MLKDGQGFFNPTGVGQGDGLPEGQLVDVRSHTGGSLISLHRLVDLACAQAFIAVIHVLVSQENIHQAAQFGDRLGMILDAQVHPAVGPGLTGRFRA